MLNKNGLEKELGKNIYVDNGDNNIRANSIDVTLGDILKLYKYPMLDISKKDTPTIQLSISESDFLAFSNKMILGRTNEYTRTYNYVPMLSNIEEIAICGMQIHITAGFGDNGFEGTWTLEIINNNQNLLRLYSDMKIGTIYYIPLIGDSSIKYEGKYQGQVEATASRMGNETLTSTNNYSCEDNGEECRTTSTYDNSNGIMLTNNEIRHQMMEGNISVTNITKNSLEKPNSCYVGIEDTLYTFDDGIIIDPKMWQTYKREILTGNTHYLRKITIPKDGLILEPHRTYFAVSREKISTKGFIPAFHGRTNLSLLGLSTEMNDGFKYDGYDDYMIHKIVATKHTKIPRDMTLGNLTFFRSIDGYSSSVGMLSGEEIKYRMQTGEIVINDPKNIVINPNSVNLTLSHQLGVLRKRLIDLTASDINAANPLDFYDIDDNGIILYTGEIYRGRTNEWTETYNYVPMMSGRSSLGRNALHVHCSGGMGSNGYKGYWHMGIRPMHDIKIFKGMKCCQIYYYTECGDITDEYEGSMSNYDEAKAFGKFLHLTRKK